MKKAKAKGCMRFKPAAGRREGDEWVCAENDTFNRIASALKWESYKDLSLQARRAYLDGEWVLGCEDEKLERDGGPSAAASTENDALVCSLMAEMSPKMLDFVASEWTKRARDFQ